MLWWSSDEQDCDLSPMWLCTLTCMCVSLCPCASLLTGVCKDVHFHGFTVDYAIPTAVNGLITEINKENYILSLQTLL